MKKTFIFLFLIVSAVLLAMVFFYFESSPTPASNTEKAYQTINISKKEIQKFPDNSSLYEYKIDDIVVEENYTIMPAAQGAYPGYGFSISSPKVKIERNGSYNGINNIAAADYKNYRYLVVQTGYDINGYSIDSQENIKNVLVFEQKDYLTNGFSFSMVAKNDNLYVKITEPSNTQSYYLVDNGNLVQQP